MPLTTNNLMLKKILWVAGVAIGLLAIVVIAVSLKNARQGKLTIQSDLSPTTITINGQNVGIAPLTKQLAAGHYTIVANAQQKQQEKQIDLAQQENSLVFFNFNAPEGPEKIQKIQQLNTLVTQTLDFTIDLANQNAASQSAFDLTITLNAVFNAGVNGPSVGEQKAEYQKELKQFKQEALDWIKSKGADPAKLKIQWIPPEAENI